MAIETGIEWATSTFNPWIGCTKVSPECAHCYAETLMDKRWGRVKWGKGQPRARTSEKNWRDPLRWNQEALATGQPHRVFCASLADWLDDEVDPAWLGDLLELISRTPALTWMLLSKRPENFQSRMQAVVEAAECQWAPEELNNAPGVRLAWEWSEGFMPSNVWVGATAGDQARAALRVPQLVAIPARLRFLSCEPLLEKIDLGLPNERDYVWDIQWVICGGESGPGCRPMEIEWARDLMHQVHSSGASFFMKQLGGHPDKRHELAAFPSDLRVREVPDA